MPVGRETASFCPQHIEYAQELARNKAHLDELEKAKVSDAAKIRELEQKTAHLSGFYEGAVPKLQSDVSRSFKLSDERHEQAQLYQGQVRALAQKVQDTDNTMDDKADKQFVQAEIRNVYRWVTVGFVGWGLTILAFALYIVLARLGVKGP